MHIFYHKIHFMQWRTTHLYYLLKVFIIYYDIILPFIILKFISRWIWFRFQCNIFKYCHQMAYITFSFDKNILITKCNTIRFMKVHPFLYCILCFRCYECKILFFVSWINCHWPQQYFVFHLLLGLYASIFKFQMYQLLFQKKS